MHKLDNSPNCHQWIIVYNNKDVGQAKVDDLVLGYMLSTDYRGKGIWSYAYTLVLKEVKKNGGEAVLTSSKHKSGSDRIFEAFTKLEINNDPIIHELVEGHRNQTLAIIHYEKLLSLEPEKIPVENLKDVLSTKIIDGLKKYGFSGVLPFQNESIRSILNGDNSIISAPTGSGKTEAFIIPILQKILEKPIEGVFVLLVYPLNALIDDQVSKISDLIDKCELNDIISTYSIHGGQNSQYKDKIISDSYKKSIILATNFDFINYHLILQDKKWNQLFKNAKIIVMDEAHSYTSFHGSNVYHVLKRMKNHMKKFQIIGSSATLDNSKDFFSNMYDLPVNSFGPSILYIIVGCSNSVLPNFIPNIARRCCSNCEVLLDCNVWWPELCTRGAISLINSWSSLVTNISIPKTPAPWSTSMVLCATSSAFLETSLLIRAGAIVIFNILSSWMFSTTGNVLISPVVLLAAITDTSILKSMNSSTISDLPSKAFSAIEICSFELILKLPLPSYASLLVFNKTGKPNSLIFASNSILDGISLNFATGILLSFKNFFWVNLSWIIRKVSGDGLISHVDSKLFKTVLSPDSISYVIISLLSANSFIDDLSLKSATICSAPTFTAGQFSVGSRTIIFDMSNGMLLAASVNIMPNWPPPIIPSILAIMKNY